MKNKKYFFAFAYLLLVLAICSCAVPLPVVRLVTEDVPNSAKRYWFGSEQVFLTHEGVDIVVSFSECTPSDLIFLIEVINRSENDVLVEPEKIYYESFKQLDSVKTRIVPHYVSAYDPEEKILRIDKEQSVRDAEDANNQAFNTVVSLISITADVSASLSKNDTQQARQERDNDRREQEADYQDQRNDYLNATQSLNEKREYWANTTLRKTHLPSNNSMQGTVLIPRNDKATHLKLVIPIGEVNFVVDYKQNLH